MKTVRIPMGYKSFSIEKTFSNKLATITPAIRKQAIHEEVLKSNFNFALQLMHDLAIQKTATKICHALVAGF